MDTNDLTNIRKSVYNTRRKDEPPVAREIEDAVDQMASYANETLTSAGERFIHIVNGLIFF